MTIIERNYFSKINHSLPALRVQPNPLAVQVSVFAVAYFFIWLMQQTIHLYAARLFIPAFRETDAQRAQGEEKIQKIIKEKKKEYRFKRISVPCGSQVRLDGITVVPREYKNTKRWIVFAHGNRGTLSLLLQHPILYPLLNKFKAGVIATDYQGVGKSTYKTPTRKALLDNTKSTIDYSVNTLLKTKKKVELIFWGFSWGGSMMAQMIPHITQLKNRTDRSIKVAVILDRTFSTLKNVVHAKTKSFCKTIFAHFAHWRLNSIQEVRKSRIPIIVVFHKQDGTIPYPASLGYPLQMKKPSNVTLFELKDKKILTPTKSLHKRSLKKPELSKLVHKTKKSLKRQ